MECVCVCVCVCVLGEEYKRRQRGEGSWLRETLTTLVSSGLMLNSEITSAVMTSFFGVVCKKVTHTQYFCSVFAVCLSVYPLCLSLKLLIL